jgi:L-alanine-DL-glutamate epimerase-like enolase superfamily enzyme
MLYLDPVSSGVSGVLEYADAAYGYEWPVVLDWGPGGIAAHLAPALPTTVCVDVPSDYGDESALQHGIAIRDGRVVPAADSGHGIRLGEPGEDA